MHLKPCPFCGGKAELFKSGVLKLGYSVHCSECSVYLGDDKLTKQETIKAWNTRQAAEGGDDT